MAFLERNLVFCNKICSACRIYAFVYVCTNTGCRAHKLILKHGMAVIVVTESDYFYCKIKTLLSKRVRLHIVYKVT